MGGPEMAPGAPREPWILGDMFPALCGALAASLTLAGVQDRQLGPRA